MINASQTAVDRSESEILEENQLVDAKVRNRLQLKSDLGVLT